MRRGALCEEALLCGQAPLCEQAHCANRPHCGDAMGPGCCAGRGIWGGEGRGGLLGAFFLWRKGGEGDGTGNRGVWGRGVRREVVYPRIYARVRWGYEVRGARRGVRRGRGVKSARRGERGAGTEGWYILGYMCGYDEGAGYEARVRRGRGVA